MNVLLVHGIFFVFFISLFFGLVEGTMDSKIESQCDGKIPAVFYSPYNLPGQNSYDEQSLIPTKKQIENNFLAMSNSGIHCIRLLDNIPHTIVLENVMNSANTYKIYIMPTLRITDVLDDSLSTLKIWIDMDRKYPVIKLILIEPFIQQTATGLSLSTNHDSPQPIDASDLKERFDQIRKIIGDKKLVFSWSENSLQNNYNELNFDKLVFIDFEYLTRKDPSHFPFSPDFITLLEKNFPEYSFIFQFGVPATNEKEQIDVLKYFSVITHSARSYIYYWYNSFPESWTPDFRIFNPDNTLLPKIQEYVNSQSNTRLNPLTNKLGNIIPSFDIPNLDRIESIRKVIGLLPRTNMTVNNIPPDIYQSDKLLSPYENKPGFIFTVSPGVSAIKLTHSHTLKEICIDNISDHSVIVVTMDTISDIIVTPIDTCGFDILSFFQSLASVSDFLIYVNYNVGSLQCSDNCITKSFELHVINWWDFVYIETTSRITTILASIITILTGSILLHKERKYLLIVKTILEKLFTNKIKH